MLETFINKCDNLCDLRRLVENFKELEIAQKAIHPVFSTGPEDANIMIIGEAPGREEDFRGTPFCGQSGKLLDQILNEFGLSRQTNIYITNIVFWRPENNRRPTLEEIEICKKFLVRHIYLKKPKIIMTLGASASFAVLGLEDKMHNIRGKIYPYYDPYNNKTIPIVPSFHPSYLLRIRSKITDFKKDLNLLLGYIEKLK